MRGVKHRSRGVRRASGGPRIGHNAGRRRTCSAFPVTPWYVSGQLCMVVRALCVSLCNFPLVAEFTAECGQCLAGRFPAHPSPAQARFFGKGLQCRKLRDASKCQVPALSGCHPNPGISEFCSTHVQSHRAIILEQSHRAIILESHRAITHVQSHRTITHVQSHRITHVL